MESEIPSSSCEHRDVIRHWLAITAIIVATLLWSGNFIVGRYVNQSIDPITLACWRHLIACTILMPFVVKQIARRFRALLAHWYILLAMEGSGIVLFNLGTYFALRTVPAVYAVMLLAFVPIMVVLLASVLLRTSLSRLQVAAVVTSVIGVALVTSRGHLEFFVTFHLDGGTAWMGAAVFGFALNTVLVRKLPPALPASLVYGVSLLLGTLILVSISRPAVLFAVVTESRSTVIEAILYLALGPSVIAYICWIFAIRRLGAQPVGNCLSLVPVFGTLLSVLLLGERITLSLAAGGALVLCGVFLSLSLPFRLPESGKEHSRVYDLSVAGTKAIARSKQPSAAANR